MDFNHPSGFGPSVLRWGAGGSLWSFAFGGARPRSSNFGAVQFPETTAPIPSWSFIEIFCIHLHPSTSNPQVLGCSIGLCRVFGCFFPFNQPGIKKAVPNLARDHFRWWTVCHKQSPSLNHWGVLFHQIPQGLPTQLPRRLRFCKKDRKLLRSGVQLMWYWDILQESPEFYCRHNRFLYNFSLEFNPCLISISSVYPISQ